MSSDISIIMSPRKSIIWAQNVEIFNDIDVAFKLLNSVMKMIRKVISEVLSKMFWERACLRSKRKI